MGANENNNNGQAKDKTPIISSIISGVCVIVAATIGIFSINVNVKNDDILGKYEKIRLENEDLKTENSDLKNQILSLTIENENFETRGLMINPVSSSNKVSIFDLETFKGNGDWKPSGSDERWYTDTYGNEYLTSYYANHYISIYEEEKYTPTYLFDYKFSLCEGQIAWSKLSKDYDGSAWIEFYSDDDCIYATDPITADSRALTFSFSVEGVEKLTIVRKGTRNGYQTSTLCESVSSFV